MLAVRAAPLLVVPVAAQLVSGEGPLVRGSGLQLEHFGRRDCMQNADYIPLF